MPGNKKRKIAVIIGAVVIAVAAIVYGVFYHYYSMLNYEKPGEDISLSQVENETDPTAQNSDNKTVENLENSIDNNVSNVEVLKSDSVTNILLIGTDSRGSGRGRSDAMILISINTEKKKIVLTSFLRDIYLRIPSVGNNRLNAAYAYGGAALLMKTLRENFGIYVDKYAQTDFFSFIDIIDALGGVTITVTKNEIGQINHNLKEINKLRGLPSSTYALSSASAGSIRLNGSQALAYARIRHIGTDFGRTERQRKVLTALMSSFKNAGIGEITSLMNKVLPLVNTNLTQGDILKLVSGSVAYRNYSVTSLSIPVSGSYSNVTINKMSVLGIDFEKNIGVIKQAVY